MDTREVERATSDLHRRLEPVARGGYAVSGVLHVLIGYLAVRIALGGGGGSADQSGALAQVTGTALGRVALWAAVLALAGLALWQLLDAVVAARSPAGSAGDVAKGAAKGVVYLALAVTTSTFARGGSTSSSQQSTDVTASLLRAGAGRVLVAALGLVVLGVGAYHVVKGLRKRFTEDLRPLPPGGAGSWVVRAGAIGYAAKGVALGVLGVLFVVAAVRADPSRAGGLDAALRTLGRAPFGAVLLVLVGLGFAAYGVYSAGRARYARM